jgi:hypothetical protein
MAAARPGDLVVVLAHTNDAALDVLHEQHEHRD